MTPFQESLPFVVCVCGRVNCTIPYGLCHCGCNNQTPVSTYNDKRRGWERDKPLRFIHGHNGVKERIDTSNEAPFWHEGELCRRLPLTQGQFAIIIAEHYEWLSQWLWFADYSKLIKGYYAKRTDPETKKKVRLHRFVLGLPSRDVRKGDHVNGNTLDCRPSNLRPASNQENARNRWKPSNNTSGYLGVSFHKRIGKFGAYVMVDGKLKNLGYFYTAEDAYEVRKVAVAKYYGKFSRKQKED